ncbi:hypothetical protein [Streptomyces avicenniae]|uniref:hypothetical protein n=1 Tax=Streptomyces avicenniae TaxID=500153 RepID=UPI00167E37E2|nr:hypothetical protein [Streptomyces avicenniae]
MSSLQSFIEAAPGCQGYFLDRFSLDRIDEIDALEVGLRWGPEKPDMALAFRDVYFCSIERPPGSGDAPLDQVTAQILEPSDLLWPEGLPLEMIRSSSLPALVWFRVEGPVQISVLAAIASVSLEIM